jgi:tetratricopeptide (TPR) repeat protein
MCFVRRARSALVVALVTSMCALAQGEPSEISAQDKARAAKIFRSAEGAFRQHEYARAAEQFEEANSIAPHPAALFNAARAWEKAGELRRAANLCGRYLRDARGRRAATWPTCRSPSWIPKLDLIEAVDRKHVRSTSAARSDTGASIGRSQRAVCSAIDRAPQISVGLAA